MGKYICVSLPENLVKKIDLKKQEIDYFTSRADFVKQAIRRELERLERITVKQ